MVIISRFFGIKVSMEDAGYPYPHFQAEYQGEVGQFDFEGVPLCQNFSSATASALIRKWCDFKKADLVLNWSRLKAGVGAGEINPLN